MLKQVIIILTFLCSLSGYLYAQNGANVLDSRRMSLNNSPEMLNTPLNSSKVSALTGPNPASKEYDQQIMSMMFDQYYSGRKYFQPQKQVKPPDVKSRLVSSFRENIRFGGFWDHYAIVNFTPAVNIKPFDFMSIYANQNLSCYIPVHGIKEHFKSILVHGAAILVVDNSVKLLNASNSIIQPIAGFILKNIITSILKVYIDKPSSNKIYSYNSYFYSMTIRF